MVRKWIVIAAILAALAIAGWASLVTVGRQMAPPSPMALPAPAFPPAAAPSMKAEEAAPQMAPPPSGRPAGASPGAATESFSGFVQRLEKATPSPQPPPVTAPAPPMAAPQADRLAREMAEVERRAMAEGERPRRAMEEAERLASERAKVEKSARERAIARSEAEGLGGAIASAPPAQSAAMPEFPWPPPGASAWVEIPDELIARRAAPRPSFGTVRDRLAHALDAAGYAQRSFFRVPNGFAVVTQLERIGNDGTPAQARWYAAASVETFSLEQYLRRLLFAQPGRYRLVVLVVTDVAISASGPAITAREASEMADRGYLHLPPAVAAVEYSPNHRSTALIYEFRKRSTGSPEFVKPSPLPGRDHLVKARIWAEIEKVLR